MLRKILSLTILLFLVSLSAHAQQTLQRYDDWCTTYSPTSAALFAKWNNISGQPTCSITNSHGGNVCYSGLMTNFVEVQVFTNNQHCITDWTDESFITVTPKCGGTPSTEFYIINHTCCN